MDYSTQLLSDSTGFDSAQYINLKLKSPSPSPFQDPNSENNGSSSYSTNHNNNNNHSNSSYGHFMLDPIKDPLKSPSPSSKIESTDPLESSMSSLVEKIDEKHARAVSNLDVYKKILSLTVGKDKLAKSINYLLQIIKYYLISTRRFIVNEKFTNLSINPLEHYKTPIKYLKLLLFLNSTSLEKKITILTTNIGLFRFAMRFGGTPYRIKALVERVLTFSKVPSLLQFNKLFMNEEFLGEFINFYYGIVDELYLLGRLGVLQSKSLRKFVGRHIDLAWYYDILLGLKQNWDKLSENRSKQLQLNIQYEVRKKASQLSKRLVENISNSPIRSQILNEFNNQNKNSNKNTIINELKELKHEENLIKIDLFRLICDFACDSIDVFGLNINRVVYLIFGFLSGTAGLSKVWINSKKDLQEGK